MTEVLRPMLELSVVLPGVLLAYFPMKAYLKYPARQCLMWMAPALVMLTMAGGVLCQRRGIPTAPVLWPLALAATAAYIKSLRISVWKSGTVALTVCAVFACIKSISRGIDAAILMNAHGVNSTPWLCLGAGVCYNLLCWLFAAAAHYPAAHGVREMVEDENFAQTWYVFWVLPLGFIALNLFMIPHYQTTLYTGRVLQGYLVISIALLVLLLWFSAVFFWMANSLNRNARLQRENQLLLMQQQRYENLKASIEEARQARHDMRHHFLQISALAEEGDLEKIKAYVSSAVSRIPSLDMGLCENRAVDSVVSFYCAQARREGIPIQTELDLPEEIPTNEMDTCLVLANLLENALEASLKTEQDRRYIRLKAYLHGDKLLLIETENAYDGEIRERNGVFQSRKRKGSGIGLQSVRHIAEQSGGASSFEYSDGIFRAKLMLRG